MKYIKVRIEENNQKKKRSPLTKKQLFLKSPLGFEPKFSLKKRPSIIVHEQQNKFKHDDDLQMHQTTEEIRKMNRRKSCYCEKCGNETKLEKSSIQFVGVIKMNEFLLEERKRKEAEALQLLENEKLESASIQLGTSYSRSKSPSIHKNKKSFDFKLAIGQHLTNQTSLKLYSLINEDISPQVQKNSSTFFQGFKKQSSETSIKSKTMSKFYDTKKENPSTSKEKFLPNIRVRNKRIVEKSNKEETHQISEQYMTQTQMMKEFYKKFRFN